MRILMVTAEYAPFAKTGGLADMVAGLARTLVQAGHDVRVLLPRYEGLASTSGDRYPQHAIMIGDQQLSPVKIDGTHPAYTLQQLPTTTANACGGDHEPIIYCVAAPAFYGSDHIYGGGDVEARRFALLAHSALRLCELGGWVPDIIHCHDWHAALLPVLLKTGYVASRVLRETSSILTIHNIGYQGVFSSSLRPDLGLAPPASTDDFNFLREGIVAADALTTVSPTHAAEILEPGYGKGLDGLLRQRRNRLVGILNGVDYSAWEPSTDPHLPAQYSSADLAGKAECREALIRRAQLLPEARQAPRQPVLGMVTRLAEQKGIDLVLEALPGLLRETDVQVVILGHGEDRYVGPLHQLATEFKAQLAFLDAQDESLARLVFAGSDIFLVPSLYEPCGLTQLYALRYGSVPVVRETGGLKDTVSHFDVANHRGTGSVFKHPDSAGLAWAIREALQWFREPSLWATLQQNGMAADYSWQHQAPLYEAVYSRLSNAG